MKRGTLSHSHRMISLVLAFIFAFVTAQAVWWVVFLRNFVDRTAKHQSTSLALQQLGLQTLYHEAQNAKERAHVISVCERYYRGFECQGPRFRLLKSAVVELHKQRRYVRMFVWEGFVFVILVMGGLYLLLKAIGTEREFRERQQNFLSAVSHEMRTPIGAIRLIVETLQMRAYEGEKRARYLQRLGGQLDRLQNTCEHVLSAANLDDTDDVTRHEVRELNTDIDRQMDVFRDSHDEEEVQFTFIPAKEPAWALVDPLSLELVLRNLVDNAVKYTVTIPKQVTVQIKVKKRFVSISVKDNGPGIPTEEQHKIFEAFYRVGSELTRERPGLGLGLHLVREMVRNMQGRIYYKRLETGSCFTVSVHRAEPKETNTDTQKDIT
ncbi:MAG: hypothetical protein CL920_02700 [Deltaproteobacteria bacterium]|mgnify:FL=1|nr:hypothetical protein [Deltaproteobacteria bacterium]